MAILDVVIPCKHSLLLNASRNMGPKLKPGNNTLFIRIKRY